MFAGGIAVLAGLLSVALCGINARRPWGWLVMGFPFFLMTGALIVGSVTVWITDTDSGDDVSGAGVVVMQFLCPFFSIVSAIPTWIAFRGWRYACLRRSKAAL